MEEPYEEYVKPKTVFTHGTDAEEYVITQLPDGVTEAKEYLMKAANLLNLTIACVDKAVAPKVPPIVQTTEFFTACTQMLFKEASQLIDRMPQRPIK